MRRPEVGDILHYVDVATDGARRPPLACIVTATDELHIHVTVFSDGGGTFGVKRALYVAPGTPPPRIADYCCWPEEAIRLKALLEQEGAQPKPRARRPA